MIPITLCCTYSPCSAYTRTLARYSPARATRRMQWCINRYTWRREQSKERMRVCTRTAFDDGTEKKPATKLIRSRIFSLFRFFLLNFHSLTHFTHISTAFGRFISNMIMQCVLLSGVFMAQHHVCTMFYTFQYMKNAWVNSLFRLFVAYILA